MTLTELHARYLRAMWRLKCQARQLRTRDFLDSERATTLAWHLNICSVALGYAERVADPGIALEWTRGFSVEAACQREQRQNQHTQIVCAIYQAFQRRVRTAAGFLREQKNEEIERREWPECFPI